MREKERRERIRTAAGRKGVARNILASPRAPSCVLNHFPVDSAVCSPIIGVSPPGKLLFYSRTTRAPDVPVYRDILRLFLSLSFSLLLLSAGFFSPVFLRPSRSFSRPHQSRPQPYFFPLNYLFIGYTPNSVRRLVYFALLDSYRRESYPSGIRKPRLQPRKLNTTAK